jgi:alcohol dehydrogenase class IV
MMSASMQGAMAFQKGLGCVHSLSHSLGGVNPRLHHGTLNAMFLPAVVRFNARPSPSSRDSACSAWRMPWACPAAMPGHRGGRGHPRAERPPGPAQRPGVPWA